MGQQLNIRSDTTNVTEQNVKNTIEIIGIGKELMNKTE